MRAGGGKQKGSQFEREICVLLSKWVSAGAREDLFWRAAMSGGRATVGKRKGADLAAHAGDISATHEDGHALTNTWYIECKRYADLNYAGFMLKNAGPLATFWRETCEHAASFDKLPMLIAREDRGATTVIVAHAVKHMPMHMRSDVFLLHWSTQIASVRSMNVDIHDFEAVLKMPFIKISLPQGARWLMPGEDPFSTSYAAPPPMSAPRVFRTQKPKRIIRPIKGSKQ